MQRWIGGALAALLPLLPLAACSSAPDPPGTVSADEDRQLNEAAEMLDADSVAANSPYDDGAER